MKYAISDDGSLLTISAETPEERKEMSKMALDLLRHGRGYALRHYRSTISPGEANLTYKIEKTPADTDRKVVS